MKARFTAISAALALIAVAAALGVAVAPIDANAIARREPRLLRDASVDVRFVKPVALLARADDSLMTRYPSATRDTSPAEDRSDDAASREWEMLLAGILGAVAIARRRLSS